MKSIWGKKDGKSNDDEGREEGEEHATSPSGSAGSEQTPLLSSRNGGGSGARASPPRRRSQPRFSADDPEVEVSPYNLFAVRSLRVLTFLLVFVTLAWWILLFVSTFITIPGLATRGGGWTQLSFASLALGILLTLLIFFVTPSQGERIVYVAISAVVLVNTVLVLAVTRVRYEEGWMGAVTVLWCALMAGWAILCDRVVEWAKRTEELRLVGHPESRRTLAEWLSVFTSFVLLFFFEAIVILLSLTIILRSVDSGLEPWGQRYYVESGDIRLHFACFGNSTRSRPTVLIEGGETSAEVFSQWVAEAQESDQIGRYCLWDRPGMGWSDVGRSPQSAGMVVDALSEVILEAEEDGPWVLVSHGVGSIYSRIFASRHSSDVAGIFLVDPLHEDLYNRVSNSKRGFVLWLRGVISPLGIDHLIGWIFGGRTKQDRVWGRSTWRGGKAIKARLQESLGGPLTLNEISAARAILPQDIALTVITAGKPYKKDSAWEDAQRDMTTITSNLVSWDVVKFAPHNVWENDEGRVVLKKRLGQLVDKAGA